MTDEKEEINGFWVDDYFVHIPQEGEILEETEDGLTVKVAVFDKNAKVVEMTPELHEKVSAALTKILEAAVDEIEGKSE